MEISFMFKEKRDTWVLWNRERHKVGGIEVVEGEIVRILETDGSEDL